MKARRKAQENGREKQRDRSGRQYANDDSERRVRQKKEKKQTNPEHAADALAIRAARDLLAAARSRPLPRVNATSYCTLKALTKKFLSQGDKATREQLARAWESIMLRPCPQRCQFYCVEGRVGFGTRSGVVRALDDCEGRHVLLGPARAPWLDADALGHILEDGIFDIVLQRGARYRFYWTPKIGWDGLDTVEVGLHDQDDGTETYYFCSRELESETGRPEDNEFWIRLDTVRDESHSRWPGEVRHDEDEERPLEPWGPPVGASHA